MNKFKFKCKTCIGTRYNSASTQTRQSRLLKAYNNNNKHAWRQIDKTSSIWLWSVIFFHVFERGSGEQDQTGVGRSTQTPAEQLWTPGPHADHRENKPLSSDSSSSPQLVLFILNWGKETIACRKDGLWDRFESFTVVYWLHLPVIKNKKQLCLVLSWVFERIESKCLWEKVCTVTFEVILQSLFFLQKCISRVILIKKSKYSTHTLYRVYS